MPRSTLLKAPKAPRATEVRRAHQILKYAHETAASLLRVFDAASQESGPGYPEHVRTDLVRSMVVLAGAGLDGVAKQLAQDCLPALVVTSADARAKLEQFMRRRLQSEGPGGSGSTPIRTLARVLVADSPREAAAQILLEKLMSSSLQSFEQLCELAEYLGIGDEALKSEETSLRGAFACRNDIVHRLDVDFQRKPRQRFRTPRPRDDMVEHANLLLKTAAMLVCRVDSLLAA